MRQRIMKFTKIYKFWQKQQLTCSWNEKTKSPIHEFEVLQNVFKIKNKA